MQLIKFIKTTSDKISTIDIISGQLIFSTDRKETFLDIDSSTRIQFGEIIYIDSEADRLLITTPISDKLYYTKDTDKLYSYTGGSWKSIIISSFTALSDTPSSYSGYGGNVLQVKSDESGLEFSSKNTFSATVSLVNGLTATAGNLLSLNTSGLYALADSSSVDTLRDIVLCIVGGTGTCTVIEFGYYTTTGLTAGDALYVGTSGVITNTAPTTGYVKCIGYALSTTKLKFKPDSYSKQL